MSSNSYSFEVKLEIAGVILSCDQSFSEAAEIFDFLYFWKKKAHPLVIPAKRFFYVIVDDVKYRIEWAPDGRGTSAVAYHPISDEPSDRVFGKNPVEAIDQLAGLLARWGWMEMYPSEGLSLAEELAERLSIEPSDPRYEPAMAIMAAAMIVRYTHENDSTARSIEDNLRKLLEKS